MTKDSTDIVVQAIARSLRSDINHIVWEPRGRWAPRDGKLIGEAVGQAMEAYDQYQEMLTHSCVCSYCGA